MKETIQEQKSKDIEMPAPRRRGKRAGIIIGIIAGVVIVAGAGFWIWHEQPSFCGTMCHDTMGTYLANYEDSDMLSHAHATAGVACLDCHEPVLEDQLAELQVQVSGDYRLPLAKMDTDDEFCLRDGCHTRDEIVSALDGYTFPDGTAVNPHEITFSTDYSSTESPHSVGGETIPCSTCHTMHRNSNGIEYCFTCHHTETAKPCYDCHDHR